MPTDKKLTQFQEPIFEAAVTVTEHQLDLARQICQRAGLPSTDPYLLSVLQALATNYLAECHRQKAP